MTEDADIVIGAESVSANRIQDIFRIREQMNQKRIDIMEQLHSHPRMKMQKHRLVGSYRGYVETYFSEIEPLFYRNKDGKELWENKDYGTITVEPKTTDESGPNTSLGQVLIKDDMGERYEVQQIPEPATIQLDGLSSLLELANPIEAVWNVGLSARRREGETKTITNSTQIDMQTLDRMTRDANSYLSDIGLEATLEEERDPANI